MKSLASLVIFFSLPLIGMDIGSDTTVGRFNNVQILNDGDRIAGFAAIEGGFKLFDSMVTGTFDSFFAASGEISLRGGTLELQQDLVIRHISEFQTLGNIVGNNHKLRWTGSTEPIPSRSTCEIESVDTIAFGVQNLSSDWSYDNNYIAFGFNIVPTFSGVAILNFDGTTLTLLTFILNLDAGSSTLVTSVRWHPSEYLIAVTREQSTGDELFIVDFTPSPASVVVTDSDGISFGDYTACSWHPSGNFLAVGGTEVGAELKVYPVSSTGILDLATTLTVGISPSRDIQREALDWSLTGSFLAVGVDHITADDPDLLVYQFSPDPFLDMILNATALVETGTAVLSVDWNKTFEELIAIGIDSGFSEQAQVYEHSDGGGGSLAGALPKVAGVDDLGSVAVQTVDWKPDGVCLAVGRDTDAGSSLFRTYAFDEDVLDFELVTGFSPTVDVTSVRYSPSGQYIARSDDVGATAMLVSVFEQVGSPPTTFYTWSNLVFQIDDSIRFQNGNLLFEGKSVITGRGDTITFDPSFKLLVASNSTLLFKDITLKGINGDIIQAVDDTSKIVFDNVRLVLDGDYSFTQAHFDVNNYLKIEGDGHTFNYQTDQVSTITSNAQLILDEGLIFNYDPPVGSTSLLDLLDDTASIYMQSATLATTSTGIQLERGTLYVDGRSFLTNTGSVAAEGIIFGDGLSASNNLCVEWLPAAQLILTGGHFRDANV